MVSWSRREPVAAVGAPARRWQSPGLPTSAIQLSAAVPPQIINSSLPPYNNESLSSPELSLWPPGLAFTTSVSKLPSLHFYVHLPRLPHNNEH